VNTKKNLIKYRERKIKEKKRKRKWGEYKRIFEGGKEKTTSQSERYLQVDK
jgi:hypothetical protein